MEVESPISAGLKKRTVMGLFNLQVEKAAYGPSLFLQLAHL